MFKKTFQSLLSTKAAATDQLNQATTNHLLKTGLSRFMPPAQAATISDRILKWFESEKSSMEKPLFPPDFYEKYLNPEQEEITRTLQRNYNFSSYMVKVYLTTGLAMAGTLGIGYGMSPLVTSAGGSLLTFFGGFSTSLVGLYLFERTPPTISTETLNKGYMVHGWTNSFKRKLMFSSVVAGSALFVFPLIQLMNPAILPLAAVTSMLTMGGSAYYAYTRTPDEYKIWKSVLFGMGTGIIGVNTLALIAGPSVFMSACFSLGFYKGIKWLAIFQAYNSWKAVKAFEAGSYGHVDHVVDLYQRMRRLIKTVRRSARKLLGPYATQKAFWVYNEQSKKWEYKFINRLDLRDQGL